MSSVVYCSTNKPTNRITNCSLTCVLFLAIAPFLCFLSQQNFSNELFFLLLFFLLPISSLTTFNSSSISTTRKLFFSNALELPCCKSSGHLCYRLAQTLGRLVPSLSYTIPPLSFSGFPLPYGHSLSVPFAELFPFSAHLLRVIVPKSDPSSHLFTNSIYS